jgi:tetratricopeptide (TPR) repeat protein
VIRNFGLAVILLSSTCVALAHDGPEHAIEAIDAEIARSGPSAELLFRRACEFRALRKYDRAELDLNAALKIDGEFTAAQFELARILVGRGDAERAFAMIESPASSADDALRAAAIALRGELHLAQGNARPAIRDFTAALALQPDVQWFLLRGDAQHAAGDDEARIADLRAAWLQTASPVLQHALCDALIAVGGRHLAEAREIVERELADGRYHSAWWLRRAQIRLADGDRTAAEADLRAALAELQGRLNLQRPDPTLLAERAAVCRLLGIRLPATAVTADD